MGAGARATGISPRPYLLSERSLNATWVDMAYTEETSSAVSVPFSVVTSNVQSGVHDTGGGSHDLLMLVSSIP